VIPAGLRFQVGLPFPSSALNGFKADVAGIVLPIDGVAGLRRRRATASRYISDFGVAMYCGFGRQPGADGTETMREHARVVRAARDTS
jgi:hypothetical protein